MSKPPKELVRAIIASLEKGEGWEFDGYEARHKGSGTTLWLASGTWGMSIHLRAGSISRTSFGGVVTNAVPFGWRWKIYGAARKAGFGKPTTQPQAAVAKAVAALYGEAR